MKRHRQAEYEERCKVLERREQIHKQIDTSMEKVRQNEKAIKQVSGFTLITEPTLLPET